MHTSFLFDLAPTLNVGAPWTWIRALFHRLKRSAFPRTAWERDQPLWLKMGIFVYEKGLTVQSTQIRKHQKHRKFFGNNKTRFARVIAT
jgi:hypothetical protein